MKKKITLGLILVLVLIFTGCTSVKKESAPSRPVVLGLDDIPQPEWVYKAVIDDEMHYEAGYGLMSDRQNSLKRATVEAKSKIAAWINTSVKEVVQTYVSDAGSEGMRQAMDAMEVISEQVAEASLIGVTTEDVWVDKDGGVWVLCSIPLVNIEKNFAPASEVVAEVFSPQEAASFAHSQMKDAFATLLKNRE